jgi:hypothetical protein
LLLLTVVVNVEIIFCNESADDFFYYFYCLFFYLSDSTNFLIVSDAFVSGFVVALVTIILLESVMLSVFLITELFFTLSTIVVPVLTTL